MNNIFDLGLYETAFIVYGKGTYDEIALTMEQWLEVSESGLIPISDEFAAIVRRMLVLDRLIASGCKSPSGVKLRLRRSIV